MNAPVIVVDKEVIQKLDDAGRAIITDDSGNTIYVRVIRD